MKLLTDVANLKGVKVLVRLDLNVPVAKGRVVDDFRIRRALPTLAFLKKAGAKTIVMSHIETLPEDGGPTLRPVATYMKTLGMNCDFIENYRNALAKIDGMTDGCVIMLENLRMNEGEKKNDKKFAQELASLADIYVNDAFSVSHREHASVVAITEFIPSYAGLLMAEEVKHLSSAFHLDAATERPFLFVIGGAKFETKIPLIEKFMKLADTVFVGGALANNFFKEKGVEIGTSLVSPETYDLVKFSNDTKLMLPVDAMTDIAGSKLVKAIGQIASGDSILDAGPETIRALGERISAAKYILWNGPLGAYERGHKEPTLALARMIAAATARGTKTIVGGGDTLAAIAELGLESKFTFVSTGGGAMLDFLANETLPGIQALG